MKEKNKKVKNSFFFNNSIKSDQMNRPNIIKPNQTKGGPKIIKQK